MRARYVLRPLCWWESPKEAPVSRKQRLTAAESLTVALTTITVFNAYVQQAETKVTVAATVHLGAAALAASQAGGLAPLWEAGPAGVAVGVALLAGFGTGFLVAGCHLVLALRPDLRAPGGGNGFGLVRRAGTAPRTRAADARELAEVLAEVALRKHRHVRAALPWMALTFVSVVLWTVVNAVT